jgi:Ca2+-binding EF-hand superfamily protein
MNKRYGWIVMMLAVSAFGVAAAQQAATQSRPSPMQRMDANGDGAITREEAARFPRLAERFDDLDKNHDGKLSADELPAGRRHAGAGGGPGMDPQWREQMEKQRAACFDKADSNKDGQLSREEFGRLPQVCHREHPSPLPAAK